MTARSTYCSFVLAAAVVAGACGDRGPTTPGAIGDGTAVYSRSAANGRDDDAVLVLTRNVMLRQDLHASATIGSNGGRIEILGAGITVEFAAGAVARPTRITVTAVHGRTVAYEFEPHGIRFAAPVTVHQRLKGTAAEHDSGLAAKLQGSYFDGDLASTFADGTQTYAHIKERRPARYHTVRGVLDFSIEHFSGYMVSTGLKGDGTVEIRVD